MAVSRMVTVSWCSVDHGRGAAWRDEAGVQAAARARRWEVRATRPVGAAVVALLLGEELERLVDERLVELEDAAVAGVGVDHQISVRQAPGQVDRIARGHHPIALAVGNQNRLTND